MSHEEFCDDVPVWEPSVYVLQSNGMRILHFHNSAPQMTRFTLHSGPETLGT
jgi:hypothetical protein